MRAFALPFLAALLVGCASHRAHEGAAPDIVLVTDYGTKDFYVGALHGAISSVSARARIHDATHEVTSFDIEEGAYTLSRMAGLWPAGTVFVVIVDPGVGTSRRGIALRTKAGRVYVGPDNGLFTFVMDREGIDAARELSDKRWWRTGVLSSTFHGRDVFGPVAGHLAAGTRLEDLGPEARDLVRLPIEAAKVEGGAIHAQVVHIDTYGNVSTNAMAEMLAAIGAKEGDVLEADLGGKKVVFPWGATYGAVPKGSPVVVIDSDGGVELAINMGNLGQAQGLAVNAAVTLRPRR